MVNSRNNLKSLINDKKVVRILETHSALASLIAENSTAQRNGETVLYDGFWSSSLTDSTVRGKPDTELVHLNTRLETINEIFEVTSKPLIYDGDSGGRLEHFPFMVKTLERTGVSAVIIEDKVGFKQNSLFGADCTQNQDSIEGFCEKIQAGKKVQKTDDFMIIARIESLISGAGQDDAMARANAYVKAGADGIMIHSASKTPDEIVLFCKEFRSIHANVPLIVVPSSYNSITEEELAEVGVNVIIYANHMLRAAYVAMQEVAQAILENGRSLEVDDKCLSIKKILTLIPDEA